MPEARDPPDAKVGAWPSTDACAVRQAFVWACTLDVAARKPGNVSVHSAGHGMQAALFVASAQACAPALCEPGRPVGERIEGAVRATQAAAGCNTNLGIVLLCAPLAAACEQASPARDPDGFRQALEHVLARLGLDDARAAYRAIALARPGGLGAAPREDVSQPPTLGLRDAMALAADRDRIAQQYAGGFQDVFELGLPAFEAGLRAAGAPAARPVAAAAATQAMQRVYLEFLAAFADSHIVRKHGEAVAQTVMSEAVAWRDRVRRDEPLDDAALARWDADLKARGLNPGTSADLSVAVAMLAALRQPAAIG